MKYLKTFSLFFTLLFLATAGLGATETPRFKAFGPGEKLYYRIHWRDVNGGYAKVEIVEKTTLRDREVFKIRSLARTTDLVDAFFKVRDEFSCYWDIEKKQPLRTIKNMNEGHYRRFYNVDFMLNEGKAKYYQKEFKGNTNQIGELNPNAREETRHGEIENLPLDVQDVISALYMMRSDERSGQAGDKFSFKIFDDIRLSEMGMEIVSIENISVAAGDFKAMKVRPDLKTTGFFKAEGTIFVWVSDDEFRYPLKVEATIPVAGVVTVELVKVDKPGL